MLISSNTNYTSSVTSQQHKVQPTQEHKAAIEETNNKTGLRHSWESFIDKVEADPQFAKEMAEAITFIPNRMTVDLNDVPPLTDIAAHKKWEEQAHAFDAESEQITQQRITKYNEMKSAGATDAEIFKEMISFNKSLPMDYQIKAGMLSVDEYA